MAKNKYKLIDYIEDRAHRQLMSVSYDFSEDAELAMSDDSDKLAVLLRDRIDRIVTGDDSLSCEVTREVVTSPHEIIKMSVTVKLYLHVKEKYSGKVKWETINIKEELFESCSSFFADPMSRISLIIANITASFTGLPLITPDDLIVPDERE
jgi:hypothetical protein